MFNEQYLENWVLDCISDPIKKTDVELSSYGTVEGFLDFRVLLKNTHGYNDWKEGQLFFEDWESQGTGYKSGVEAYLEEISADQEIYEHYPLSGKVLDVGGLSGTLRHFLGADVNYVCVDPFEKAPFAFPNEKAEAYPCLKEPFNFVVGNAEFLPFKESVFDHVHMRSMLDHVQIPDLALIEAKRVLKSSGKLLVGMSVDGGKNGRVGFFQSLKDFVRELLATLGFKRFKDHHTWHPTYLGLMSLAKDNGFKFVSEHWQSKWKGKVVYILFEKEGA